MLLPIAPNALHYDPDHPALGFSAVTTHFTVRHNRISIHASDGEADRVMQPGRHRGNNGPFYFERVSSANVNHPSFLHWREELGEYIAAVMFGRKNQEGQPAWELASWPKRYTFWVTDQDKGNDMKRSYLHGSPAGVFASPHEFAWHIIWLMRGKATELDDGHCRCKYCGDPQRRQTPITTELKTIVNECDGEGGFGNYGSEEHEAQGLDEEEE